MHGITHYTAHYHWRVAPHVMLTVYIAKHLCHKTDYYSRDLISVLARCADVIFVPLFDLMSDRIIRGQNYFQW